jgi:heat shock protein HslJ
VNDERLADMLKSLLLGSLVLLVVACGNANQTTGPGSSAAPGPVDAGGDWIMTAGTADGLPIPMVDGSRITLTIEGNTVSGQSACNQYFGELTVVDGIVRVGGLGGTEMACAEPVMASEAAYLKALGAVSGARMDDTVLVLLGPGVELRYDPLEPPPTAELIDTTWILDSLVQGDAVASTIGEPATLRLNADGSLEGSTGCRELTGSYVVRADEIVFTEFAAEGECAGGPADQDSHVVDVLGDGFTVTIDGQQLTLTGNGGRGLIYGAAPPDVEPIE